jgi:CDP-glucose 4,6-dehydratase
LNAFKYIMTMSLINEFAGRSVFLTGHTGFKGSWLAIWLHHLGAKVSGYSLPPPTKPSNFQASRVRRLLACHYEADIRNITALAEAIDHANPDVIFHLAAQPLVRESYISPRETLETNFMGTCNLLECIRLRAKPCVVVVITSDKCYENREQLWGYRENDPMGGCDPYSASKGTAELLVASYRNSFFPPDQCASHGIKLATVRTGNVIGGGDWARDRIVPDIVRSLEKHRPIPVRNPGAVRPWLHVVEPLSGYLMLGARMMASNDPLLCSSWNFGPRIDDSAARVSDLIEAFCTAWGDGIWEDKSDPRQFHESNILRLSIEKAVTILKWRPIWSLRETIDRTVQWYGNYYNSHKHNMYESCLLDINLHQEQMQEASPIEPRQYHKRDNLAA